MLKWKGPDMGSWCKNALWLQFHLDNFDKKDARKPAFIKTSLKSILGGCQAFM